MPTSIAPSSSHGKNNGNPKPERSKSGERNLDARQPAGFKKRRFGKEIDDIFQALGKSTKKKGSSEVDSKGERSAKNEKKTTHTKNSNKNKKKKEEEEGEGDVQGRKNRRRTGDGMAIYTEEELGINNSKAGGTPLCPFDCDCCF